MIQREIKFRAWDEEFGEMIYPFAGSYNPESDTSQPATTIVPDATDPENYTWIIYWDGASDKKEVRLCKGLKTMQFTGLRDKNKIDIYEGDIIRRSTGYLFEVMLREYRLGEINQAKAFGHDWHESDEVIGNVFETPELISKQLT